MGRRERSATVPFTAAKINVSLLIVGRHNTSVTKRDFGKLAFASPPRQHYSTTLILGLIYRPMDVYLYEFTHRYN